ncbi:MAG: hypothetical protein U9R34_04305 [Nanoarchaeota archaeon]|nr:hypothetical protein [Nanoarchaeota archaeon]
MAIEKYLVKREVTFPDHNNPTFFEALIVNSDKSILDLGGQVQCEVYSSNTPYELGKKVGSKDKNQYLGAYFDDRLPPELKTVMIFKDRHIVRYSPLGNDVKHTEQFDQGVIDALTSDK